MNIEKRAIKGYGEMYSADTLGNIYKGDEILKSNDNGIGYRFVKLRYKGKCYNRYVHRLVWLAFMGDIPKKYEINHKNHDKSDNSLENLEIVTHSENVHKAFLFHGYFGSMNRPLDKEIKNSKLTCPICGKAKSKKAILCKACHNDKMPNKDILVKDLYLIGNFTKIGEKYNVTDNAIRKWCLKYNLPNKTKILKNKNWIYEYNVDNFLSI